jgi:hypothetical protein
MEVLRPASVPSCWTGEAHCFTTKRSGVDPRERSLDRPNSERGAFSTGPAPQTRAEQRRPYQEEGRALSPSWKAMAAEDRNNKPISKTAIGSSTTRRTRSSPMTRSARLPM